MDASKTYFASKSQCTRTAGDPGGVCNDRNEPRHSKEGPGRLRGRTVFITNQQLVNGDTDQTKDLYQYILPTASEPESVAESDPGFRSGAERQS